MKIMIQYLFQRKFKSTSDLKFMRYFGCFKMFFMNIIVFLCLKQCYFVVVQIQFILINFEGFFFICCRNNCKYNCQVECRDCFWCMYEEDLIIFFCKIIFVILIYLVIIKVCLYNVFVFEYIVIFLWVFIVKIVIELYVV